MLYTSGMFLFANAGNKFLIVHPTHSSRDIWSIPKGECTKDFEITAIKELKEETNITIPRDFINSVSYIGNYTYRHHKKVLVAFELCLSQYELEHQKMKCTSMVTKDKHYLAPFPEVDDFKWVTIDEGLQLIHYTQQRALIDLKKGKL